jgi:hypothetical protein
MPENSTYDLCPKQGSIRLGCDIFTNGDDLVSPVVSPLIYPLIKVDKATASLMPERCFSFQVSPSEAATLLQALAIQARVTEAEELAARIEALEEKLGVSK